MSAECRKCGFDLDGDFSCANCDRRSLKSALTAAQAENAALKEKLALAVEALRAIAKEYDEYDDDLVYRIASSGLKRIEGGEGE